MPSTRCKPCRDVKALSCGPVAPLKDGEPFHLGSSEQSLFDGYATEHMQISGTTPLDYFSISVNTSTVDALYGEPEVRAFLGPFRLYGNFKKPNHQPYIAEEGFSANWPTTAWIPRKAFEDAKAPLPAEGDVIHVWSLPIYETISTLEPGKVTGAGFYFDVLEADADGYMFDNPTFVGWTFNLKRRAQFTPERRISPP